MAGVLATALSHLGGIVCVDGRGGETIISAIADGTAKAGQVVGITTATNVAAGTDDAAFEFFTGILLPRYDTDVDTVPTSGDAIEIVIPKSGRHYNVAIVDPGGDKGPGIGFVFGTTAGNMEIQADIVVLNRASGTHMIANTSRFAEVTWT